MYGIATDKKSCRLPGAESPPQQSLRLHNVPAELPPNRTPMWWWHAYPRSRCKRYQTAYARSSIDRSEDHGSPVARAHPCGQPSGPQYPPKLQQTRQHMNAVDYIAWVLLRLFQNTKEMKVFTVFANIRDDFTSKSHWHPSDFIINFSLSFRGQFLPVFLWWINKIL